MRERLIMANEVADHYRKLAPHYDRLYMAQSRARANFIRRHFPLSRDDQLIDIGGGTAQISLMLWDDLKMTNPVVCIDPNPEMLAVARSNGAITIQSTAEDFLANKPDYPLKAVLVVGCFHHFQDPDFVVTSLARHLPRDGGCMFVEFPPDTTLPWFGAVKRAYPVVIGDRAENIRALAEAKGLECRVVAGKEPVEMGKGLWYEFIRKRLATVLLRFSDEELEKGIEELEEKFKDMDVLKFDLALDGVIVKQKN